MKKVTLKENEYIKLLKFVLSEALTPGEDKIDMILDKISQSGMESITPEERETLEKFTKGISIEDKPSPKNDFMTKAGGFWSFDFPGMPSFKFRYESTQDTEDEKIHTGYLTVNDSDYYGEIYCDTEGNFQTCMFENTTEGTNLFEDHEDLEQDIEVFLDVVCNDLKEDDMIA
jgi:hypothetical protein